MNLVSTLEHCKVIVTLRGTEMLLPVQRFPTPETEMSFSEYSGKYTFVLCQLK